MTSRRYCFTSWVKPQCNPDIFKYMCFGEEICPSTLKLHFQGYLELYSPARISAVKKYLKDDTVHLEKAKGDKEQNRAYCRKDGEFVEYVKGIEISVTSIPVTPCDACDILSSAYGFVCYCRIHRPLLLDYEKKLLATLF